MNKHLEQLIKIASLDKEIDSFEPRIQEAKKELDILIREDEEVQSEIELIEQAAKDISLSIAKHENHLQDTSNKLEEIAKKTKLIKTEKEHKALSLEEELAKEQITFVNEEIARLNTLLTNKKDSIVELKEKLKLLHEQQQQISLKVQTEVDKVKAEQKEVFLQKEKLVTIMDQKIISFYEKIRKWARNTSVVPISRQACGGCFMRINDKVYSDVIRSDDIITCPHCGRILYHQEENA